MKRKKKNPGSKATVWLIVTALALAGGALLYVYGGRYIYDHRRSNFLARTEVYVLPGDSAEAVLSRVTPFAKDARSLSRAFRSEGVFESGVQPGRYLIEPALTSTYVARMFSHGWQSEAAITLSGSIRTRGTLAKRISSKMMIDSTAVADALKDNSFLAAYGTDTTGVFSLFIPDTYSILWTASVEDIFARFKKEYDAWWTSERKAKAEAAGLSPYEVSVLASIVDGETKYQPEMARIAGVYLNRLKRGMLLQADPTVAYCFGYSINRVLKKHLEVNSPYNTYKFKGLPPGPISVPPKACLEAVLNAEKHSYIYFCASPELNGTHRFATNLSEHNANAVMYQRALTAWQKKNKK